VKLIQRIRLFGLVQTRFSEYLVALEHYDAMAEQNGTPIGPREDEAVIDDFAYYIIRDDHDGESF